MPFLLGELRVDTRNGKHHMKHPLKASRCDCAVVVYHLRTEPALPRLKGLVRLLLILFLLAELSATYEWRKTMRKLTALTMVAILAASTLSACHYTEATYSTPIKMIYETERSIDVPPSKSTSAERTELVSVSLNTDGFGDGVIAMAKGDEELVFDESTTTAYMNVEKGTTVKLGAKPAEDSKVLKWTMNGEDIGRDEEITLVVDEDLDIRVTFGLAGSSDVHVDMDSVSKVGEIAGLPQYGYSFYNGQYVCAVEQDGNYYRIVAAIPQDVEEAVLMLDWEDEEYEVKKNELLKDLDIVEVENLSANIPDQAYLDSLIEKTGKELMEDGWSVWSWNTDELWFSMSHTAYSYVVTFEGELNNPDNFEGDMEDMAELVVASVEYEGMGDLAYLVREDEDVNPEDAEIETEVDAEGNLIIDGTLDASEEVSE